MMITCLFEGCLSKPTVTHHLQCSHIQNEMSLALFCCCCSDPVGSVAAERNLTACLRLFSQSSLQSRQTLVAECSRSGSLPLSVINLPASATRQEDGGA